MYFNTIVSSEYFNTIVSSDTIPHVFNLCSVVPVYKGKGRDPTKPGSYRHEECWGPLAPKYFLLSFNGTPHPLGCTSQLDRASCSGLVVCFSKNFSSCARTAMQGFWNNTVTLHDSMLCACTVYGFSGDKHVITPCSCNIWYTRTKPEGRTRKGVITYTYTITSSAIIITIIIIALVTVMKLYLCFNEGTYMHAFCLYFDDKLRLNFVPWNLQIYIHYLLKLNVSKASIKRFLKRNLPHVGMVQHWLTKYKNKKCHAYTMICTP